MAHLTYRSTVFGGLWLPILLVSAYNSNPSLTATVSAPSSAAYGLFGASVSVSSNARLILVGAPNASAGSGAAYAVSWSQGHWNSPEPLPISASPGDAAGSAVALSGNSAVVGSPGAGAGAATIFDQDDGGDWDAVSTLTSSGTSSVSVGSLGAALAWSGSEAVIVAGAPTSSVGGAPGAGAAVVFASVPRGSAFVVAGVLSLGAAAAGDGAFSSVATSFDGFAVVGGAPQAGGGAGAASLFAMHLQHAGRGGKRDGDGDDPADDPHSVSWIEMVLVPSGGPPGRGSSFGAAVALSGDGATAAVGAPGSAGPGTVYIFSQQTKPAPGGLRGDGAKKPVMPGWVCTATLGSPASPAAGDGFGSSLALNFDGSALLVGAVPLSGGGPGAAYAFSAGRGGTWTPLGAPWAAPSPAAADGFGHSLGCNGGTCAVGTFTLDGSGRAVQTGNVYVWDGVPLKLGHA